jgi:hypothetical protein
MINPEYLHYFVDGSLIAAIAGVGWKANRTLNRWLDVMKDFPPHRHVNGIILYPEGMTPGAVEKIGGQR